MDVLDRSLLIDLVSATKAGDLGRIRLLLDRGVRPDVVDSESGLSALHAAVMFHTEALEIMLPYARSLDRAIIGGTALSYVVHEFADSKDEERRAELISALKVLLRAGANPQAGGADPALGLARLYNLPDLEALLKRPS